MTMNIRDRRAANRLSEATRKRGLSWRLSGDDTEGWNVDIRNKATQQLVGATGPLPERHHAFDAAAGLAAALVQLPKRKRLTRNDRAIYEAIRDSHDSF